MGKPEKPENGKHKRIPRGRPALGPSPNIIPVTVKISIPLNRGLAKICKQKKLRKSQAVRCGIELLIERFAQEMIESGAS